MRSRWKDKESEKEMERRDGGDHDNCLRDGEGDENEKQNGRERPKRDPTDRGGQARKYEKELMRERRGT